MCVCIYIFTSKGWLLWTAVLLTLFALDIHVVAELMLHAEARYTVDRIACTVVVVVVVSGILVVGHTLVCISAMSTVTYVSSYYSYYHPSTYIAQRYRIACIVGCVSPAIYVPPYYYIPASKTKFLMREYTKRRWNASDIRVLASALFF